MSAELSPPTSHENIRSNAFLSIALLLTGLNMAVFGQLYVDVPDSFFGAANTITRFGTIFSVVGAVLVAVAGVGFLRASESGQLLALATVVYFAGPFLPLLLKDPVHSLPVIAWQAYVFVRILTARRSTKTRIVHESDPTFYLAHRNAAVFAVLLTVAIDGFRLTDHPIGLGLCGAAHIISIVFFTPTLRKIRKEDLRLFYFLLINLGLCFLLLVRPTWGIGFATCFQIFSLYASSRKHPLLLGILDYFLRQPALFVTLSFFVVILLGALFLTFPMSTVSGYISPIDALFTAVSAVCVTGLAVLDTPTVFTQFGQTIILLLIQLGGLGIMTLSTIGAQMITGNLGLLAESSFGALLDVRGARSVYKLIRVILFSTILVEALGALLLSLLFRQQGLDWSTAAWKGLFHAVSAFCNAGFALQSDSLVSYSGNVYLLAVIMGLIIAGGLGFPTVVMVADHLRSKKKTRLPLQARIILYTTFCLIIVGWVGFTALEWNGVLSTLSGPGKLLNGLFQSVTLRTAGFNSVPMDTLRDATVAFMIIFMFIGAAPSSTAGGIKVTTFAVLLAAIPSFGHGEGNVEIGGRRITPSTMYRAVSVVIVTLVLVLVIHFGLLISDKVSFPAAAFEAVSAVGTVGLSTGITPGLSAAGKFIVIIGMFAGRLGPLTIMLAIAGRVQRRYTLAAEPVMVG